MHFVQTTCEVRMNFTCSSYEVHTKCMWTSCELRRNRAWSSHEHFFRKVLMGPLSFINYAVRLLNHKICSPQEHPTVGRLQETSIAFIYGRVYAFSSINKVHTSCRWKLWCWRKQIKWLCLMPDHSLHIISPCTLAIHFLSIQWYIHVLAFQF